MIKKSRKPIAKFGGVPNQTKKPLFGFLKNSVDIKGDVVSPVQESWAPILKFPTTTPAERLAPRQTQKTKSPDSQRSESK